MVIAYFIKLWERENNSVQQSELDKPIIFLSFSIIKNGFFKII